MIDAQIDPTASAACAPTSAPDASLELWTAAEHQYAHLQTLQQRLTDLQKSITSAEKAYNDQIKNLAVLTNRSHETIARIVRDRHATLDGVSARSSADSAKTPGQNDRRQTAINGIRREGSIAFHAGKPLDANPYITETRRRTYQCIAWATGWLLTCAESKRDVDDSIRALATAVASNPDHLSKATQTLLMEIAEPDRRPSPQPTRHQDDRR